MLCSFSVKLPLKDQSRLFHHNSSPVEHHLNRCWFPTGLNLSGPFKGSLESLTIVGFADRGGGAGSGEASEEAGLLTLLLPTSGDEGEVIEEEVEETGRPPALFGGRAGVGGEGNFGSSFSTANFSSVALRSAIRSAMRASRSLSSSSCRDSNTRKDDRPASNQ